MLVGHSMDRYPVHMYARDYPEEVAGLVLIDPQNLSTEDAATPIRLRNPAGLPAGLMARIGLARLLAVPSARSKTCRRGISKLILLAVTPRSTQTLLDEGKGMSEGGAQARL